MSRKETHRRKYYLHRQLKKQGFTLQLGDKTKTINVLPEFVDSANRNKYLAELQNIYSYGVQYLNPMIQNADPKI